MKRRTILTGSLAGLAVASRAFVGRRAHAGGGGPMDHFVMYEAGGGWDTSMLIDPKSDAQSPGGYGALPQVAKYQADQVLAAGAHDGETPVPPTRLASAAAAGHAIRYAPNFFDDQFIDNPLVGIAENPDDSSSVSMDVALDTLDGPAESAGYYNAFFFRYAHRLRVINGIDLGTSSHDTGHRLAASGAASFYPNLAAAYAGLVAPERPLAFLSDEVGYSETLGLTAPTRLSGPDIVQLLAQPNVVRLGEDWRYFTDPGLTRVRAAVSDFHELSAELNTLPKKVAAAHNLREALASSQALPAFVDAVGTVTTDDPVHMHARIAAAAFASDTGAACHIAMRNGFDTHGDNDARQAQSYRQTLKDLHVLLSEMEAFGLSDRVYMLVASDLGRLPWYNAQEHGKDHYSVTSNILIGPTVSGNTVVQATDDFLGVLDVDPKTLQPSSGGTRLSAAHIHQALREALGIAGHAALARYPFDVDASAILGA